jgi:hypothetical protein
MKIDQDVEKWNKNEQNNQNEILGPTLTILFTSAGKFVLSNVFCLFAIS